MINMKMVTMALIVTIIKINIMIIIRMITKIIKRLMMIKVMITQIT